VPKRNEVEVLRDQITDEVNGDAQVLGRQLFAGPPSPDLERANDEQLQTLYRAKYQDQDREWLQAEARRDPRQFIKVARQIGVLLPAEMPSMPMPSLPQPDQLGAPGTPPAPQPAAPAPTPGPEVAALQALEQALAGPSVAGPALAAPPPVAVPVPGL